MTVDINVEPEPTPADDTEIVVAPTIVVSTPDPEPASEPVESVERVVETAERLTALENRVSDLEMRPYETPAPIVVEEPVIVEGDVTEVTAEDDAEVVVDNTPESIPWTHKNLFKRGN